MFKRKAQQEQERNARQAQIAAVRAMKRREAARGI